MAAGHVKEYITRVASIDGEIYPRWDLTKPLPKLPVPDIHMTLQKYLDIMTPILTPEQLQRTKLIVKDFGKPGGLGEFLQQKLKNVAETKDNWAYSWWLDDMYMRVRLPLPINCNPGIMFPARYLETRHDQLRYAARLISGILDYKTVLDVRGLPIDRCRHKEKGQPLCMEQYYRLFSSYRVPGVKKDSLITNSTKLMPEPEHIIVVCMNQFFVLDVVINFTRMSEDDLFTQLDRITKMANESEEKSAPIGLMTAAPRDRWAVTRMQLMEDSTNRDSLDAIERSLFILCLDKALPISFNHQQSFDQTSRNVRDDVSIMLQMLHGCGSKHNSGNRWFDKTMQFIISEDGACGLNFEHSPSDGIAVVQLIQHLLRYMEEVRQRRLARMRSICELPYPRRLQWKFFQEVLQEIEVAATSFDRLIDDLDFYILKFDHFGREFPKSQNMSPDSFIQLALQLTYYKIHGRFVSTYESASTRRFRLGRVDNIRANSIPALEWVKAMVGQTTTTDEAKLQLLQKAMDWQTKFMTEAILGKGIDCHLLGLRELAAELGIPTPDIFTDEAYKISNHFSLSTSQVPTETTSFLCGYGPVVPDGYGVCYNPQPDKIVVCVSSFKSCPETSSDFFAATIESSFLQMYELCLRVNAQRSQQEIPKIRNFGNVNSMGYTEIKSSPRKTRLIRQKNTDLISSRDGDVKENGK
ncbi:hypothetical protein CHS0354_041743 [Potamilus streckersoni]|uniref:Choline O-acetyltransferase n=1 Tax=Potamilus streckersoni TaxID=2493646 RepID=A0AAE0T1E8_9BIVA|nr:hypothetical protein CHS0354_041743 [Potamilus streckersoni]